MARFRSFVAFLAPAVALSAPNLPLSRLVQPRTAWFADCDGEPRKTPVDPELVGFSGPRFDRFEIHFDSIADLTRDRSRAFGRTRFQNAVCNFSGTLSRTAIQEMEANSRIPGILQRNLVSVDLVESGCPAPGRISGELEGFSFRMEDGKVTFATEGGIEICGDGPGSDLFRGTWKALKGKTARRVRWGWRRIPDGEGLDCGSESFAPCATVRDSAWTDFTVARDCRPADSTAECLRARAREGWWKPPFPDLPR